MYTNLFTIAVRDQDRPIIQHNVLAELTIPGLDFAGLLSIASTVRLSSDFFLFVQGGTMNVDKFGLQYGSKQDMKVEWDIKNSEVGTSGWSDLTPKIVAPLVKSMPEQISFFGALGPEFGAQVSILRKSLISLLIRKESDPLLSQFPNRQNQHRLVGGHPSWWPRGRHHK